MMAYIENTFESGKRKREWQVVREAVRCKRQMVVRPVPHVTLREAWMAYQSELCQAAFHRWRQLQHEATHPYSLQLSHHSQCASQCHLDYLLASSRPHLCTTAFTVERNMVHDTHKVLAMAAAGCRTSNIIPGFIVSGNEVLFDPQPFLIVPGVLCINMRSIKTLFVATEQEASVLQPLFALQYELVQLLENPEALMLFKSEQHIRKLLRSAALLFTKITHPASGNDVRVASLAKAKELCRRFPALAPRQSVTVTLPAAASVVQDMPFATRRALALRRNQLTGMDACGYYI